MNKSLQQDISSIINKIKTTNLDKNQLDELVFMYSCGRINNSVLKFYLNHNLNNINKLLEMSTKDSKEVIKQLDNEVNKELISVIIPTYNRKKMLVQAIKSVLEQSYKSVEIIIIDDNSSDGTEEIVKKQFPENGNIVYYNVKKNQGPGTNRLVGYEKFAKGNYIIFMDDDDFFVDNKYFEKCMEIFKDKDNISFIAADTFIYYQKEKKLEISKLNLPQNIYNKEYFLNFQTVKYPKPNSTFTAIFSRKVLEKTGLRQMKMVNDSSIYLRALLYGNPILLDHIVGVYRIHSKNITFSCNCDFILENIDEKYRIAQIAISNYGYNKIEINKWFDKQLDTTLRYQFQNTKVNLVDYRKIILWLKNNNKNYYKKNKFNLLKMFIKKYF